MLRDDTFSRLRGELGTDLATPRTEFESLMLPRCPLNRRDVLPTLVVAWTITMMQCVENAKSRLPCCIQNLQHMRNTLIRLCNGLEAIPYLAAIGNEIVVRVDHKQCGHCLVVCHCRHSFCWIQT